MCRGDNYVDDKDEDRMPKMNGTSSTAAMATPPAPTCMEQFGNRIDKGFVSSFARLGTAVAVRPKTTIAICIVLTIVCGLGFAKFETENRQEELWVPQNTKAEDEEKLFDTYFPTATRFNQIIVKSASEGADVLTKEQLLVAMKMHKEIETSIAGEIEGQEGKTFTFLDLCVPTGGSCASFGIDAPVCKCLVTSILKQWNYDVPTLEADNDWLTTLNEYGTRDDLTAVLGKPLFDANDQLVSAEAFVINYFIKDQSYVEAGSLVDPIGKGWEGDVFLKVVESVPDVYPELSLDYFATRSFEDVFGGAITGDLGLVNISYLLVFLYLGANMGKIRCGTGSRWTLSLAGLFLVGLSIVCSMGIASLMGLFWGPVHSLLPFLLLGIGVDDSFVIVNAFDRERKMRRAEESDDELKKRASRALGRSGSSVTVTSLTNFVAFAISSASALPALGSFCAYAAIAIFFLWAFSATLFTAALILDERRQRENRRECLCCVTRKGDLKEDDDGMGEGLVSRYFRNYHAPAILSPFGKFITFAVFGGLLAIGVYGTLNLSVEDSGRKFIPEGTYVDEWLTNSDALFEAQGTDLFLTFTGSSEIYDKRVALADLSSRLVGLSTKPPYISEPVSEEAYRNVMSGYYNFIQTSGTGPVGAVDRGDDGWPTNEGDFVRSLALYASFTGPGAMYAQDVSFSDDRTALDAFRVKLEYVKLTKEQRGRQIDDAEKLIDAMDATRALQTSWDDLPPFFARSEIFLSIEGFKIIKRELYLNVGLALVAVGTIIFFTIASVWTSFLITLNVALCIVEILGFMYIVGIVIDSVAVINLVLAVGLSVDYSAHVGHCFMSTAGADRNARVTESLADVGAAVLNGALSTFAAVAVLLFSSSYVFEVLSKQFALTVGLGIIHGLVALPVMLSLFGPRPYSSAHNASEEEVKKMIDNEANGKKMVGDGSDEKDVDLPPTEAAAKLDADDDEDWGEVQI